MLTSRVSRLTTVVILNLLITLALQARLPEFGGAASDRAGEPHRLQGGTPRGHVRMSWTTALVGCGRRSGDLLDLHCKSWLVYCLELLYFKYGPPGKPQIPPNL